MNNQKSHFGAEFCASTRLSQRPTGFVLLHLEDWPAGVLRSNRAKEPPKLCLLLTYPPFTPNYSHLLLLTHRLLLFTPIYSSLTPRLPLFTPIYPLCFSCFFPFSPFPRCPRWQNVNIGNLSNIDRQKTAFSR